MYAPWLLRCGHFFLFSSASAGFGVGNVYAETGVLWGVCENVYDACVHVQMQMRVGACSARGEREGCKWCKQGHGLGFTFGISLFLAYMATHIFKVL